MHGHGHGPAELKRLERPYLDKGEVSNCGEGGTVDASCAVHIDTLAARHQQM